MIMNLLLIVSVFISLFAVFVAIYLINLTEYRMAWIVLSLGLLLAALLRIVRYVNVFIQSSFLSSPYLTPVGALIVSISLFIGLYLIIPIFKTIKASEERYRSIFDTSGISLWEEDLYDLFMLFEKLKLEGVVDLRDYLVEHPDFIDEAIKCMKVLDVNQSTLDLFKSKNKEKFLTQLSDTFTPISRLVLADIFVSMFNGGHIFEAETQYQDLDGNIFDAIIKIVDPIERKPGKTSIISITDITARVKAEKKLLSILGEKNTLLKELYHRTKNNMQVIISMLNLRSYSIDNEIVSTAFDDMIGRIESMSLVHEKLYQSENLSVIKLDEYIEELIPLLVSTDSMWDPEIQMELDLESVSVDIDKAIPCGLIINELISNTYKHAFKNLDSGEIKISLHNLESDKVEIIVADDGVGLPPGFDFRQCNTLGIQTIFALGEDQLHGSVEILIPSGGKGSEWRLVFTKTSGESRI